MKQISVTYTSHKNRRGPPEQYEALLCMDDQAADILLELGRQAPFTFEDALFMGTRCNALARNICALEEMQCRVQLESDKILKITSE